MTSGLFACRHLAYCFSTVIAKQHVDRCMSSWIRSQCTLSHKIIYPDYGDPAKVLEATEENLRFPKEDEVMVRMLAAPVNPADINTIQGVYPVKPPLPAIAGNEGVGEVTVVGSNVKYFKVGDRVIPKRSGWGTWRTHAVGSESEFLKVSDKLGLAEAATLTVNPCTAYRMLKDFVELQPGDTVVQNGANGACGQYVIQLCKAWDIKTVNIVRNRDNLAELKDFLMSLGGTHVVTEEELRSKDVSELFRKQPPRLALNAVGGKNATEMLRHLRSGGVMVTYGGMSRQPVTVPTSAFIFKNLRCVGFWMTRWSAQYEDSPERSLMLSELEALMISGILKAPVHKMVPFGRFQEAVANALSPGGFAGTKYILDLQRE